MRPSVLAFGEVLWDLFPGEAHLGGAALNFAAHFALQGGEAWMLSALGRDELGEKALSRMKEYGLNTSLVEIRDLPTGSVRVTFDGAGQPRYEIESDTAYDDLPGAPAGNWDALYFGSLALRGEANRRTLECLLREHSFREVFVDINLRQPFVFRENVLPGLENATILKVSDEELPLLAKTVLEKETATPAELAKAFPQIREILLTRGSDGAERYDCAAGGTVFCPAEKVSSVSPVGAGDSFSAVYLHRRLTGLSPEEALFAASRVAAFVVTRTGAVPTDVPKP